MAQAESLVSRVGQMEPTMSVAHELMRGWIDLFMKNRRNFVLSPRVTGLILDDQKFALNIPLPHDFRDTLRQGQTWFIAMPVGDDKWRCQVTTPERLSKPTQKNVLKKTYLTLIQQIARVMKSRDTQAYSDEDLVSLQELARELFRALPQGIRQSLAGCSPEAVFTTLQR